MRTTRSPQPRRSADSCGSRLQRHRAVPRFVPDVVSVTILLAITLPLWLLAGFGDWWCHRRTLIHRTSGPRESVLHLVLYLVIAVPLALGLFLRINAPLLVFMVACVCAHSAIALWDSSYSQPRRYISPVEQMIHSHLEMLPVFALGLVLVLHWDAVVNPDWSLVARQHPLPAAW